MRNEECKNKNNPKRTCLMMKTTKNSSTLLKRNKDRLPK